MEPIVFKMPDQVLSLTKLDEWLLVYEERYLTGWISEPLGWYNTPEDALDVITDCLERNPKCSFVMDRSDDGG